MHLGWGGEGRIKKRRRLRNKNELRKGEKGGEERRGEQSRAEQGRVRGKYSNGINQ